MKKILKVEGIMCEGCVKRINNVLKNVKGLINYSISLENKEVFIEVKNEDITNEIINLIKRSFDIILKLF